MAKLDINDHAYTRPDRLLIEIADRNFIFCFLVGSDKPEEVEIAIFDLVRKSFFDPIKPPREFAEALSRRVATRGRQAARASNSIAIDAENLYLASRGVISIYSLVSKSWRTVAVPFLEDKNIIQISGHRVVCCVGEPHDTEGLSKEKITNHGIYSVSLDGGNITTHVDTSRRPMVTPEDGLPRLRFFCKPVPLGNGGFLMTLQGQKSLQVVGFSEGQWKVILDRSGFPNGNLSGSSIDLLYPIEIHFPLPGRKQWHGERIDQAFGKVQTLSFEEPREREFGRFQDPRLFTRDKEVWLLTDERTSDGRRILKYWPDGTQSPPVSISLRLGGVQEKSDNGLSDEDKRSIERLALSGVERLNVDERALVLLTQYGLWWLEKKKWDEFIKPAVQSLNNH